MDSCNTVHDRPKAARSLSTKATGGTDHRRTSARARVHEGVGERTENCLADEIIDEEAIYPYTF